MNQSAKTNQFFRLVMLLSRGRYISVPDMSKSLATGTRTIYRYLSDLETSGIFKVERRNSLYRISPESLFFAGSTEKTHVNEEEALVLFDYLRDIGNDNAVLKGLKEKLKGILDNRVEWKQRKNDPVAANVAKVYQAIGEKHICILRDYYSARSDSYTDRIVEPFYFLGRKNDVRCYELSTKQNKTFKLSRCKSVEVLDLQWQCESEHRPMYTDIFHFSGEDTSRVRLLMGNRSKTILLEETPEAAPYLIPQNDGRWMLDAEYCSFVGVARFYLGLFEDIEIIESPDFIEFLKQKVQFLTHKINK